MSTKLKGFFINKEQYNNYKKGNGLDFHDSVFFATGEETEYFSGVRNTIEKADEIYSKTGHQACNKSYLQDECQKLSTNEVKLIDFDLYTQCKKLNYTN